MKGIKKRVLRLRPKTVITVLLVLILACSAMFAPGLVFRAQDTALFAQPLPRVEDAGDLLHGLTANNVYLVQALRNYAESTYNGSDPGYTELSVNSSEEQSILLIRMHEYLEDLYINTIISEEIYVYLIDNISSSGDISFWHSINSIGFEVIGLYFATDADLSGSLDFIMEMGTNKVVGGSLDLSPESPIMEEMSAEYRIANYLLYLGLDMLPDWQSLTYEEYYQEPTPGDYFPRPEAAYAVSPANHLLAHFSFSPEPSEDFNSITFGVYSFAPEIEWVEQEPWYQLALERAEGDGAEMESQALSSSA